MSYWAGYSGQGLCLTEDEYKEFLNSYVNVQTAAGNRKALREVEKLDEDECLDDIEFFTPSGEKFSLFCADDGCTEGFCLVPYRKNGKPNEEWDTCPQTLTDNMYVLECERRLTACSVLKRRHMSPMKNSWPNSDGRWKPICRRILTGIPTSAYTLMHIMLEYPYRALETGPLHNKRRKKSCQKVSE